MALILGISKHTKEHGALCSSDSTDPALDRFLRGVWSSAIESGPPLVGVAPGLYPLTLRIDYDVAGFEVLGVDVLVMEGAREGAVDAAFERALAQTGRVAPRMSGQAAARTVVTTILLEVPDDYGCVPHAAPEVTASFTDVVRDVLSRLTLVPGDHLVDLHVAAIGDQWSVAPAGAVPVGGIVPTILQALRQAGLLAEGGDRSPAMSRVSLLVRAPASR